jgi:transcriptional regulator with XRE-family HTH domain
MSLSDAPRWSQRVLQERIARNWRQRDLAEQLGTSVLTIQRWEGGSQQPSAYFRVKLCALFGKSAQELGFVSETSDSLIRGETKAVSSTEGSITTAVTRGEVPPRRQIRATTVQQRNRMYLLGRLRLNYETLLKKSLQGATRIELGLAEKAAAVSNAATLLLRVGNQEKEVLPTGTSLAQVYEEAEHELLILGAPGAGKSTLLIELALHLGQNAIFFTAARWIG